MKKVNVVTSVGVKKQPVSLPKDMYAEKNLKILAQALRIYEDRLHSGLSRVKTRSEVVASKRKIYRQKGTGRARHGAVSAPIFVGGGKAHGPKGVKKVLTLPKKMKKQATRVALGLKVQDEQILLVDNIGNISKSKQASDLLKKVGKQFNASRFTLFISHKNKKAGLFFRNLADIAITPFSNMNAYSLFKGGFILIDKEAIDEKKEKESQKPPKTKSQKQQPKVKKTKDIKKKGDSK